MSTVAIVLIVVAAIVLVVIVALSSRAARERKLEQRRVHAGELRDTAQSHTLRAERERAVARERLDAAERQADLAREHQDRADELDPDVDLDAERDDREVVTENGRQTPAETGRRSA